MTRKALIFGISGQDGSYLTRLLLDNGYEVHGVSRDAQVQTFSRLRRLELLDRIVVHSASMLDFRNLLQVITEVEPDEIYNLAGQSSVALSFSQPMETYESIASGTLQVLEVLKYLDRPVRFYNACSSECFGNVDVPDGATETTLFQPRSPYATAKAAAYWATSNYREAYGLFACSGILFNHESVLRSQRFVTKKILRAAVRIANGDPSPLTVGNIDVSRDWGYAPEYVDAMWRMLRREHPDDFVIATGESHTLREFIDAVFRRLGLEWEKHVRMDSGMYRPADILTSRGRPDKARERLGWGATTRFTELVGKLVDAELEHGED